MIDDNNTDRIEELTHRVRTLECQLSEANQRAVALVRGQAAASNVARDLQEQVANLLEDVLEYQERIAELEDERHRPLRPGPAIVASGAVPEGAIFMIGEPTGLVAVMADGSWVQGSDPGDEDDA